MTYLAIALAVLALLLYRAPIAPHVRTILALVVAVLAILALGRALGVP